MTETKILTKPVDSEILRKLLVDSINSETLFKLISDLDMDLNNQPIGAALGAMMVYLMTQMDLIDHPIVHKHVATLLRQNAEILDGGVE